jgi:hypothetical protein
VVGPVGGVGQESVVEVVVEGVGDAGVDEWQGVGVLPERGGGIGVAESGLGLEDLTAGHEEGGDVVAELVEGGVGL